MPKYVNLYGKVSQHTFLLHFFVPLGRGIYICSLLGLFLGFFKSTANVHLYFQQLSSSSNIAVLYIYIGVFWGAILQELKNNLVQNAKQICT